MATNPVKTPPETRPKGPGALQRAIQGIMSTPGLEGLSEGQLEALAKSVIVDDLKAKLKFEAHKAQTDQIALAKRWLKQYPSKQTRRSFRYSIQLFLRWLGSRSILEVNAQTADDYILYLRSAKQADGRPVSDSSIIVRIAAVSSFYGHLVRWDYIDKNPFLRAKKPKRLIEKKTAEQVPSNDELDKLEQYIWCQTKVTSGQGWKKKVAGAKRALACLRVLRETGLRVSALPNLVIAKGGKYSAKSKGGVSYGQLRRETRSFLSELGLDSQKPFDSYRGFPKYYERASAAVGIPTGVHGIRHRFAMDHYSEFKDIVVLKRLLGHSSLTATQAYLASLNIVQG